VDKESIDAVFFDVTRTLIYPEPSSAECYVRVASTYGIRLDLEEMKAAVKELWRDFFPLRRKDTAVRGTNEEYEKNWWREFIGRAFEMLEAQCPPGCFEEIFHHFSKGEAWSMYPDTLPVLTELRGKGYRTGLISNFDRRLLRVLAETGLDEMFDHILVSSVFGWEKPDRPIFDEAARQAGLPPERCLHVGDSYEADFVGAREAGFVPVLLVRDGEEDSKFGLEGPAGTHGGFKIGSLSELLNLLW